jgi:hypothetical protein
VGTVYPLTLTQATFTDPEDQPIAVTVSDGSLTVANPSAVAGDLNANGRVEVGDATVALRIAVGLDAPTPARLALGDVAPKGSPNGRIDVADALRILRRAIGLDADPWP